MFAMFLRRDDVMLPSIWYGLYGMLRIRLDPSEQEDTVLFHKHTTHPKTENRALQFFPKKA